MKTLLSFRETKVFTKNVIALLSEESYFAFQDYLQQNHLLGDVIPGAEGLRKIRWGIAGKGKRGGVRVVYYATTERGYIYLLAIFGKNQQADLDKDQLQRLVEQTKEWLR